MSAIKSVKVVDTLYNELKSDVKLTSAAIGTAKKTGLCTASPIEIPCRSSRLFSLFPLIIQGISKVISKLAGVAECYLVVVYRLVR